MFFGQVFVGNDAIYWLQQIRVRIESGVEERNGYTLACISLVSIQPDVRRNNRKTVRCMVMIMVCRLHC